MKKVSITAKGFSPKDVDVKKGTEVEWCNDDTVVHTVSFDAGATYPATSSGDISPGSSWSHTFPDAGSYAYKDEKGTGTGTVKVT